MTQLLSHRVKNILYRFYEWNSGYVFSVKTNFDVDIKAIYFLIPKNL